jgi:long-chain acyl-CoA synthetase
MMSSGTLPAWKRVSMYQVPNDALPIGRALRDANERFGDRPAVIDGPRALTYAELDQRSLRVANALLAAGARRGDRIVVLADNRLEWAVLDQAIYRAGLVRVALLPRLHVLEVAQIADDSDPCLVIVDGTWLADAGAEWIPKQVLRTIVLDGGPEVDREPTRQMTWEQLEQLGDDRGLPDPNPDAPAWIAYTSGSTGLPKGVTSSQRTIGTFVRNVASEMTSVQSTDVALHTAPLSHFSGGVGLAMYLFGAANSLRPSFEVGDVIAEMEHGRANVYPMVPTQITMLTAELAARSQRRRIDVSRVKLIPYAGSAIAPDRLAIAQRMFGPVMLQFYGATESPMPLTALAPDDHRMDASDGGLPRLASAGRVNRFVELCVLGPEGRAVGEREPGEIVTRGPHVTLGYWRNPEATAEAYDADGWFHTGDVGYLEGGLLFIVDRKKDMIVSGGFNVYPREVENAISSLPGVDEVVVVGAPSERWGEEVTAVISLAADASLSAAAVIAHCRTLIGGYKVPKRVEFVDELPKNGAGKLLRRAVRDHLWEGHLRNV